MQIQLLYIGCIYCICIWIFLGKDPEIPVTLLEDLGKASIDSKKINNTSFWQMSKQLALFIVAWQCAFLAASARINVKH